MGDEPSSNSGGAMESLLEYASHSEDQDSENEMENFTKSSDQGIYLFARDKA